MSNATLNATINEAIGRSVRIARTAKGLTLVELAAQVGCTQPELTRLERGQQAWSAPMVLRVSKALQVPVEMIFPSTDHVPLRQAS